MRARWWPSISAQANTTATGLDSGRRVVRLRAKVIDGDGFPVGLAGDD
jgi:hypothetical protein